MKKNMIMVLVALATMVLASAFASAAVPVQILDVKVNDVHLDTASTNSLDVNRGEDMEVKVLINSSAEFKDATFRVSIDGYKYGKYERDLVEDTQQIDFRANTTRMYTFHLTAPVKISTEDYDMHIDIAGKTGSSLEQLYPINFGPLSESDAIVIKDFSVSPSSVVEAGRPLSFKVQVKNYGDETLDDVKVKVSIPSLGIADDEYLDSISADESETFEELLLRIPRCADPGTYTVQAVVDFGEYESTVQTMTVTVLEGGVCEIATPTQPQQPAAGKTVVTVPESQEVVMGTTGGVYPVMISNLGSTAKTYTLTASGADAWGTVRFDPAAVVVVQPESVKTVYMYVAASENAQPGAQVFKLTVDSDSDSKQVVLTANVQEGQQQASYDSLRRGLEIGLIVLVVILIILGLIIGFNKLKGNRDDEDESQTYY